MSMEPPTTPPPRATKRTLSLVLVNTGDGKGKSTAAFGTAMRAIARGWRVAVIQFLKSEDWGVGEEKVARQLGVDWWTLGDGFTWDSEDMDRSRAVALEAWRHAQHVIMSGDYQLVVLDEVTYPINWGWFALDDALDTIANRPSSVNLILTGRDAPREIVDVADTVTEMRKVKHAYDEGIAARRGIDY